MACRDCKGTAHSICKGTLPFAFVVITIILRINGGNGEEHNIFPTDNFTCDWNLNQQFGNGMKVKRLRRGPWDMSGMVAAQDISRGQRILAIPMSCIIKNDDTYGTPAEALMKYGKFQDLLDGETKVFPLESFPAWPL